MLLIQDAWIQEGETWLLHPELEKWYKPLARSRKKWAKHTPMSVLQWYFWRQGWQEPASALIASKLSDAEKKTANQYWVVSPYHASISHGRIAVMPDALFPWTEEDAQWLVALLNPMLKAYHIELTALGACLLAKSSYVYDVEVEDFAVFSGDYLPNRIPSGEDALRFMCMVSEMQVLLAQSSAEHRKKISAPDIRGIWFWGMSYTPATRRIWPSILTHDLVLLSLLDGEECNDIFTDIHHMDFCNGIPKFCVLASSRMSMLAEKSFIPRFTRYPLQPKRIDNLGGMHQRLLN